MNAMLQSFDPASRELVWEGPQADAAASNAAIAAARAALPGWRALPVEERIAVARRYATILGERRAALAELISRETGKLLWESDAEVGSMIAKVEVSIKAHAERTGERAADMPFGRAVLRHRGHGVMAVLGPYNFPGHLPNGHIVPA
ncbi:MAG: aldehyde dehydrogenase family protein, partial [Sphingobium sp.]